jgi:hypothetical protein
MHEDARALVDRLRLAPHPEGGFFRETFRSSLVLPVEDREGTRAASTAIYFLLPSATFSAFHVVRSDEVWHFYDGDPLELVELMADGTLVRTILGRDLARGQVPQHVVRADVLQAARPLGERFALVGCTVAPGFVFDDFAMPSRAELTARFPQHAAAIVELTRV